MEKFQELRESAKERIKIADHILTMTYPLVKDPKLLLVVLENVFLALTKALSSLLYYERVFKRIPPFHDNFVSKFQLFKERCVRRYKIDKEYLTVIKEVKDIILFHKNSPVEFVKNDRFVICSEDYQLKTISYEQVKDYIKKAKLFIELISQILSKNESIFK